MAASETPLTPSLNDEIASLVKTTRGPHLLQLLKHYDRLGSGFVTSSHFFTSLWQALNLKLSPSDEQDCINRFDVRGDRTIDYRLFCKEFDLSLDTELNTHQEVQHAEGGNKAPNLLGTAKPFVCVDRLGEERFYRLLERLAKFYALHGLSVKASFARLDQQGLGTVSESRFFNAFPGPPSLQQAEVSWRTRVFNL